MTQIADDRAIRMAYDEIDVLTHRGPDGNLLAPISNRIDPGVKIRLAVTQSAAFDA